MSYKVLYRDQLVTIALLYTNIIYLLIPTLHYPFNYTSAFPYLLFPCVSSSPDKPSTTRHVVHSPCIPHHPLPPWWSELSGSSHQLHPFVVFTLAGKAKRKEETENTPRKEDSIPISLPSPISVIWKYQQKDQIWKSCRIPSGYLSVSLLTRTRE